VVAAPNGHKPYALPKIASTGSSAIIACVDTDNNINFWEQTNSPPWFKHETVASAVGGSGGVSFPAIAWTGNSVIVAALTGSGDLDFWWQGSGHWHKETVANVG